VTPTTAPIQTHSVAVRRDQVQPGPHEPKRLLWQLALINGLAVWIVTGTSIFFSNNPNAVPQLVAYASIAALAVGLLTLLALQRVLAPLRVISTFIADLPTCANISLSAPSYRELRELSTTLNQTAQKLHMRDISLNHAFNELQERQNAFDHHAILSILDFDGQFLDANDLLCEATGYARHELLGRPFTRLDPNALAIDTDAARWAKLRQGQVWHGEMQIKPRQGPNLWLETCLAPVRDLHGAPHQIMCIQTDITERKQSEQGLVANQKALEMMTANMEQLIKERTAELELANDELAHANQVKSEFISIVSHELRTPLTSIKSFADILNDEIDDPESKNYLRIINEEAERLNRLINDILDMQKIDAGRMVWRDEKINLIDVTRAAVESFSGAYLAKGITLKLDVVDAELHALTDSDKIRQVLANLLSNALKFTQRGKVIVSVRQVGDNDGKRFIQTAVCDNGPGLAASQLERVFEQFYQVENDQSRKIQGTGLGLTICKQIVEHYQGKIWAESALGSGATMLFRLPASSSTRIGANE